jgi:hypothetical protein
MWSVPTRVVRASVLAIWYAVTVAIPIDTIRHTVTVVIATMHTTTVTITPIRSTIAVRPVVNHAARQEADDHNRQHGNIFHITSDTGRRHIESMASLG